MDWTDNSTAETGFNIERGNAEDDPIIYIQVGTVLQMLQLMMTLVLKRVLFIVIELGHLMMLASSDLSNVLTHKK